MRLSQQSEKTEKQKAKIKTNGNCIWNLRIYLARYEAVLIADIWILRVYDRYRHVEVTVKELRKPAIVYILYF